MFKTVVFLSVIFAVIFKANSLQCYVCYDCEQLSDDYLTSCDSLLSTTTISTSTTSTTQPTSTITSTSTSTSTTPSSTTNSTESTTSNSTTTTESTTSSSTTTTTESTTTPTTNTTNTTTTTEAPQLQVSNFAETANTTWECVKGTIPVNGSDVIVRGCAAGRTNETCDIFGLSSCSFCSSDKCNAAGSIQASVAVLAVAIFAYIVKDF